MNKLATIVFFSFLGAITLLEGLGTAGGRGIAYFLVLLMPFFSFWTDIIQKKPIQLPKKITLIFIILTVFLLIATFFAFDVQWAFEYSLFEISCFLMCLYVYCHKEALVEPFIIFITIISAIVSLYSLALLYAWPKELNFLIPHQGYQYVYPFYKTQNPIGSFLVIVTVILLAMFLFTRKKRYLLFFFPFFILLLFSYSRASYLAFSGGMIVILLYLHKNHKRLGKKILYSILALFIILTILFLSSTQESMSAPVFKQLHILLQQHMAGVQWKTFLGGRDVYFNTALKAFWDRPLFGYGPNNFFYASYNFPSRYSVVETSHNIFLDFLAEGGLGAFVCLLGTIYIVIRHIIGTKYPTRTTYRYAVSAAFIAVLILFQVDAAQKLYSYFLIFFVLLGLSYEEKGVFGNRITYFLIATAFVLLILAQSMLMSSFFYMKGDWQWAYRLYPLNSQIYPPLIQQQRSKGNYKSVMQLMSQYRFLHKESAEVDSFERGIRQQYNLK